jgi:hypothetical protein
VHDGETRFALSTLLAVLYQLAVTDKMRCDVSGFFMSPVYIDCYHYITSKFTLLDEMSGIRTSVGRDN